MSLDGIREYLAYKSPQKLISILAEQENILEKQVQKLSKIKEMIRSRIEQTNKGVQVDADRIFMERQSAENLFLGPTLPDKYDLDYGWTYLPDFYAACNAKDFQLGFTVGTMVSHKNLLKRLWSKPSHYFYRLPDGQYESFFTKPEGNYVIGTDYADYGQVTLLYQKLMRYIEENKLQICGNAYEEYLIDEIAEENPNRYLLQIAVQVGSA